MRYRALLPTPSNDAVVREAYVRYREHKDRQAIKQAAVRLGCQKWNVTQRGRILGLARIKEKPWSAEELAILERWAWCTDVVISRKLRAAGFQRTATGVHLKSKRLRLKANIDGYSQRQLGDALGVDHHAIKRWMKAGWLAGVRRQTERTDKQGGDMWYFAHSGVRRFVLQHPDEVDLCKVEKWWFLDLITGGKIGCP